MTSSSDESDYKRRKKDHKKKSKKKKRKRDYDEDDRKKSKKRSKKDKKRRDRDDDDDDHRDEISPPDEQLVEALYDLLEEHPLLASDLPVMLIRLVEGTSFDLTQMTSQSAADSLQLLFQSIEGLIEEGNRNWKFRLPPGGRRDELVLIRSIRKILDDQGLTMEAIQALEHPHSKSHANEVPKEERQIKPDRSIQETLALTQKILSRFGKDGIGKELIGLCEMIQSGEVIAIDELPDEALKSYLKELFVEIGLEKTAMDAGSDAESGDEEELGYALTNNNSSAAERLKEVIQYCEKSEAEASKPKVKGPALPTAADFEDDSSDEEGPALPGASKKVAAAAYVSTNAKEREDMMRAFRGEVVRDPNQREEWMVDPGKFDFLSAVKSGHPMKSRSFKPSGGGIEAKAMDPEVKAEIDTIMQAHQESRGQSLLEQHRAKKQQEKKQNDDQNWKWSRDDLDAGRRVDKNALKQVFGGASELKSKFHGGFGH